VAEPRARVGSRNDEEPKMLIDQIKQRMFQAIKSGASVEKEVLRKRPYLKKEWCIRVLEQPLRSEIQEGNRYRF